MTPSKLTPRTPDFPQMLPMRSPAASPCPLPMRSHQGYSRRRSLQQSRPAPPRARSPCEVTNAILGTTLCSVLQEGGQSRRLFSAPQCARSPLLPPRSRSVTKAVLGATARSLPRSVTKGILGTTILLAALGLSAPPCARSP